MGIDELCALPVADLAAPDSALFLWATFPQLPEALRLIQAWGFTYKSVAFVWLKKNRKADSWFYGLGFWTRGNAEICLLATRGHPKRQAANIHQFIISPIEAHSKKPDEARDKIVALMGDVPVARLVLNLNGVEREAQAQGSGPVDATFKAIESLVHSQATLQLYSVNAITQGTDSQGEVTVRLERAGRIVNGNGSSTTK